MREPIVSTTRAGDAHPGLPAQIGPPALRAAGFSVLLYLGWMLLSGLFHPSLEWFAGRAGSAGTVLLYFLCLDGFALGLSAAFLSGADGQNFRALGLWFFPGWWRQAAVGGAAGSLCITLVAMAVARWRGAIASAAALDAGRLSALILFFLLAAAFEELMFRGYGWQRLADSLGLVTASLISSLLFGLAHAGNPRSTLLSITNTILAGVLMCVVRARSQALWMPLGLHFGWNLSLGVVFQYPVSGYQFSGVSSAAFSSAPDWLTGGPYGLEGSLILTAVAALAILVLSLCPRNLLSPMDFRG